MSTPGVGEDDLFDDIRNSSRSDDMGGHPDTWTRWFDVDTPTSGYNNGDYETVYRIQRTNKICEKDYEIAAAECYYNGDPQTTFTEDTPRNLVKDDLQRFCTTEGLICRNEDQYYGDICQDYSIRFRCHYNGDKDDDGSYPQFDVRIYIILAVVPILIFLLRMLWTYVCRRRRQQRRNERRARQRLNRANGDDIDDDSSSVASGVANPPPSYQDLFGKTGHGTSGSSVFAISRDNIPICRQCQRDSCSVASIIGKQRTLQNAAATGQSVPSDNDAGPEEELQTQPNDASQQQLTDSANADMQQYREAEYDRENIRQSLTGADLALTNSSSVSLDAAISFSAPTEVPCLPSAPVEDTSSQSAPAEEPISLSASKREPNSASFPIEELSSSSVPTEELSSSLVPTEELSSSSFPTEELSSSSVLTEESSSSSAPAEEPNSPLAPTEDLSSSPLAIESPNSHPTRNETPNSPSSHRETPNSPSKLTQSSFVTLTKAPISPLTSPESQISPLTPINTANIPIFSMEVPVSHLVSTEMSNSHETSTDISMLPSIHTEASNSPSASIEAPNSQSKEASISPSTPAETPNSPSTSLEVPRSPVSISDAVPSQASQEVIIDITEAEVADNSSSEEAVLNQTSFGDTSNDASSALDTSNVEAESIPDQTNPHNGVSETLEASAAQSTSFTSSSDLTLSLNPSFLNPADISEPCACPCHRTIPLKQQGAAGYDNQGYAFEGDVEANRHPSFPGMHIPVFGFHRVWSDVSVASSIAQADLPTYDVAIELIKENKTKEAESQTRSN